MTTLAPPRNPCNGRCGQPLIPHRQHLFVGGQQFPLRPERDGAYAWLPTGDLLWRSAPGAIQALKLDVKHWLANAEVGE